MKVLRKLLKGFGTLLILVSASVVVGLTVLTKFRTRNPVNPADARRASSGFLVFLHSFEVWERDGRQSYLALEIDRIGPVLKGTTRVDWLVFSNSGVRFFPSLVHTDTREVFWFGGKPMRGNYVVLWLARLSPPPPSVKIYDQDFSLTRFSRQSYYLKGLRTAVYEAKRFSNGGWDTESFLVEYDALSRVEINTVNYGRSTGSKYRETYRLISDSFGL